MDEILKYLVSYLSFIYKEYGFGFIDSRVSSSFGGDAYLILQNGEIQIRIVSDRGQLFMDFRSCAKEKNSWYSSDVVIQLVTGVVYDNAVLDGLASVSIEKHFAEIMRSFLSDNYAATEVKLKKLERERSKRIFG